MHYFTEVITKNNIKQTDKFTTCGLKNFSERDHYEVEIFPTSKKYQNRIILRKNIEEQTLRKKYTGELCNQLLWKVV